MAAGVATMVAVTCGGGADDGGGNFFRELRPPRVAVVQLKRNSAAVGNFICHTAKVVVSPPPHRIYSLAPWGTATSSDRYRGPLQLNFRFREVLLDAEPTRISSFLALF